MAYTYSTGEAKARFSEVLRRVRSGQSVFVTYHGERVAEIRPVEPDSISLEDRLRTLESSGVLTAGSSGAEFLEPLAASRGAVRRFLESRD